MTRKTYARVAWLFIAALTALLASCDNLITRTPPMDVGGGYEAEANSAGSGALTVTASVSGGASRHAMPSLEVRDFAYAALLYPDGSPTDNGFIADGSSDGNTLSFLFTRPEDPNGYFTLEIFAFKKDTEEKDFSRTTAILSGKREGLTVGTADSLTIGGDPIALSANEDYKGKGEVDLKVRVPDGCTLEIDDTTNFVLKGTSPDFTITQNGDGIEALAYPLTLTVEKGGSPLYVLSEYINVLKGMCTDTWDGCKKGEPRVIDEASFSTTVYVRGTGGWYDTNYASTAKADDNNFGSFLAPLETIQKAVDKVRAMNDGKSDYTIYVDGALECDSDTYIGANGMADFSALDKNLTLTIKALSGTATLDAGGLSRVIYASLTADSSLTLENLVITGGNAGSDNGGGLYLNKGTVVMENCEITGNNAEYAGGVYCYAASLRMDGCKIKNNNAVGSNKSGGGVYFNAGAPKKLEMKECEISGNTASNSGGGVAVYNSTSTVEGGTIIGNEADSDGGGVYVQGGTFTIEGCTVSGNSAKEGGGIRLYTGTLTMTDCTIGGSEEKSVNTASYGGGLCVSGTFTMKSGEIIGNKATSGGGVFIFSGTSTMNSGEIIGNTATNHGGGVTISGSSGKFEMEGGTIGGGGKSNAQYGGGVYVDGGTLNINKGEISGNTASIGGGGVYVVKGGLDMKGGKICENNAQYFAGIYVKDCEFTMAGGEIGSNSVTSTSYGSGGVYVGENSTFAMSGSAKIDADNDVYLPNENTITVADALTAEKVATITPASYTDGNQVLSAGDGVTLTQDICDQFAVTPKSGTVWKIAPSADGTQGVLKSISTVYLNSSSGSDANSGDKASKAVMTLKKAVELTEEFSISEIIVCATYTLPSGEASLLNRAGGGKSDLTLVRYDGSSDVSGEFTGNMLEISQNVTIANVTLDGNKDNVTAEGSLLRVSGATVTLGSGTTITGNNSTLDGGGIYVENGGSLILNEGCQISDNTSATNGGGIYIEEGSFTTSGGSISGNTAGNGGAFYANNTTLTIKNCEIKNNKAGYGGAFYSKIGLVDLQGVVISGNTTSTSGTVYIGQESAILTMSGVTIENNKAYNGGGIFLGSNATAKISDSSVVIRGNSAGSGRGPGINLWNGYLELSGSAKIEDVVGFEGANVHVVKITGALTGTTPVATISPQSYTSGTTILTSGGVTITQDICDKFALYNSSHRIVPNGDGTAGVIE